MYDSMYRYNTKAKWLAAIAVEESDVVVYDGEDHGGGAEELVSVFADEGMLGCGRQLVLGSVCNIGGAKTGVDWSAGAVPE